MVDIEQTAHELAEALNDYSQETTDRVKEAVDEQADETVQELRKTSPKDSGGYAKGWRKKKAYEARFEKRNTVHNAKKYQLTHLLEYPHARKNTDRAGVVHTSKTPRTAARVHIKPVEERAIKGLEEKIKKAVRQ